MKTKLAWRFRKGSEADPFNFKPCGCKFYVYDGTVVRSCEEHYNQNNKPMEVSK